MKKFLVLMLVVATTAFFMVGCTPANNAPVITSTAVETATAGTAYTYTVTATDADSDTLTYSVAGPTGMAISTAGVITWTPTAAGSNAVIVTVSDGTASVTQSFTITVAAVVVPANNAPVITSTAVTTATVGTAYTYTVVATDADGDTLTYELIALTGFVPAWMSVSSAGVISGTPTAAGTENVTVKVSDGTDSVNQSYVVTVSAAPVGPSSVALTPLTATNGEVYTGTASATAGDNATLTYTLTTAPTGMTITSAGVITWTPAAAGTESVTVLVTDGAGLTSSGTFAIVVAARTAPTITAIADQTVEWDDDGWTLQVVATAGTGSTLTYSLSGNPVSMSISTAGLITWTTIPDAAAIHEVIVTVDAGDGTTAPTDTFIINVTEPAAAPAATYSIAYSGAFQYSDGTTQYVKGGSSNTSAVVVTFTSSVALESAVKVYWDDGTSTYDVVTLTADATNKIFTGNLAFGAAAALSEWTETCEEVCVKVINQIDATTCCDGTTTELLTDVVTVDFTAPCASFVLTVADCSCESEVAISWTTQRAGTCATTDCCGDACSGLASWEFIANYVAATSCASATECASVDGTTCPITGSFSCTDACFGFATEGTTTDTITVNLTDNVGNLATYTWTVTLDTDEVTQIVASGDGFAGTATESVEGVTFVIDNSCATDVCSSTW